MSPCLWTFPKFIWRGVLSSCLSVAFAFCSHLLPDSCFLLLVIYFFLHYSVCPPKLLFTQDLVQFVASFPVNICVMERMFEKYTFWSWMGTESKRPPYLQIKGHGKTSEMSVFLKDVFELPIRVVLSASTNHHFPIGDKYPRPVKTPS